jgi:hypothetical protein
MGRSPAWVFNQHSQTVTRLTIGESPFYGAVADISNGGRVVGLNQNQANAPAYLLIDGLSPSNVASWRSNVVETIRMR